MYLDVKLNSNIDNNFLTVPMDCNTNKSLNYGKYLSLYELSELRKNGYKITAHILDDNKIDVTDNFNKKLDKFVKISKTI